MCRLPKTSGSVQTGYRPVYISSNNINNTHSQIVNVIPISSRIHKRLPVHVELHDYQKYGLQCPSMLMMEQLTTISIECLDYKIGEISDESVISKMQQAAAIQFPFLSAS